MVSTDGRTDGRTDTEGYNIIPRHTLVAGYKKGSDVVEYKLTLQGIYGASMNAFQQVVVKIWISRKL